MVMEGSRGVDFFLTSRLCSILEGAPTLRVVMVLGLPELGRCRRWAPYSLLGLNILKRKGMKAITVDPDDQKGQ